jgi:hypothetical protein
MPPKLWNQEYVSKREGERGGGERQRKRRWIVLTLFFYFGTF